MTSSLRQNAAPGAVRRQLSGLIGAGLPAIRSQTDRSADARPTMGAVELPSDDGHSWVAWWTFAGVILSFLLGSSMADIFQGSIFR